MHEKAKAMRGQQSLVIEEQRLSDISCPAFLRVRPLDQLGHSKEKKT